MMPMILIQCLILGATSSETIKIQRNPETMQLSVHFPGDFPVTDARGEVAVTDAYEDGVALNVLFGAGRIRVLKKKEYVDGQRVDFFPGVSHFPEGQGRESRIELKCEWSTTRGLPGFQR